MYMQNTVVLSLNPGELLHVSRFSYERPGYEATKVEHTVGPNHYILTGDVNMLHVHAK